MKALFLTLILIPVLSFAQLSNKDKKSVETYLYNTCDCVNNVMDELHPKVYDVIMLMAENSEEEALKQVELLVSEMSEEETVEFSASFQKMDSAEFAVKIDNCESTESVSKEIMLQIDGAEGPAFDHLLDYLYQEEVCSLTKTLYNYGAEAEE